MQTVDILRESHEQKCRTVLQEPQSGDQNGRCQKASAVLIWLAEQAFFLYYAQASKEVGGYGPPPSGREIA